MILILPVSIVNDHVLEHVETFSVVITGQDRVEGGQNVQIFVYDDDSETKTFSLKILTMYMSSCLSVCVPACVCFSAFLSLSVSLSV